MARRKNPNQAAPDYLRQYFETGAEPDVRKEPDDWFDFILINENGLRSAWEDARQAILPAWVRQYPCTRPFAWWRYGAHQKREKFVTDGKLYYENQGAYLKRHDLLSGGEEKHLAKHKEQLAPVPQAFRYKR